MLAEETDPNRLYDLQRQLEDFNLYNDDTIYRFCPVFYDGEQPDELIQGILDEVVERLVGPGRGGARGVPIRPAKLHPPLRLYLPVDYLHRRRFGEIVRLCSQPQQKAAETRCTRRERCAVIGGFGFVSHAGNPQRFATQTRVGR